jgi:aspartate/methionine/tyrosine aminotransferase
MRQRIVVNSMSKLAPPEITDTIRKVHDFLTVGAATPLQHAGVTALNFGPESYRDMAENTRSAVTS